MQYIFCTCFTQVNISMKSTRLYWYRRILKFRQIFRTTKHLFNLQVSLSQNFHNKCCRITVIDYSSSKPRGLRHICSTDLSDLIDQIPVPTFDSEPVLTIRLICYACACVCVRMYNSIKRYRSTKKWR